MKKFDSFYQEILNETGLLGGVGQLIYDTNKDTVDDVADKITLLYNKYKHKFDNVLSLSKSQFHKLQTDYILDMHHYFGNKNIDRDTFNKALSKLPDNIKSHHKDLYDDVITVKKGLENTTRKKILNFGLIPDKGIELKDLPGSLDNITILSPRAFTDLHINGPKTERFIVKLKELQDEGHDINDLLLKYIHNNLDHLDPDTVEKNLKILERYGLDIRIDMNYWPPQKNTGMLNRLSRLLGRKW